ncbi:hypothetical protein GCM10022198_15270 [Klugiella xanthotipulae]
MVGGAEGAESVQFGTAEGDAQEATADLAGADHGDASGGEGMVENASRLHSKSFGRGDQIVSILPS